MIDPEAISKNRHWVPAEGLWHKTHTLIYRADNEHLRAQHRRPTLGPIAFQSRCQSHTKEAECGTTGTCATAAIPSMCTHRATEKGCADGKRKLGGEVTHDRVRSWNIA